MLRRFRYRSLATRGRGKRAVHLPILAGWPSESRSFTSWLYKSKLVAADTVPLLMGRVGEDTEPLAWVREKLPNRGRVFYTCLGHQDDFGDPAFVQLLQNGVNWAVR
jgi:hypothetical protein